MGVPALGSRMHCLGLVLSGTCSEAQWIEFLHAVVTAIGMSVVDDPKVWNYPVAGKGGVGQTICLPISESFLVLDTWKDHSGAYLLICSCQPFFSKDVDKVAGEFGLKVSLKVGKRFFHELELT